MHRRKWLALAAIPLAAVLLVGSACAGDDEGDGADGDTTATVTSTSDTGSTSTPDTDSSPSATSTSDSGSDSTATSTATTSASGGGDADAMIEEWTTQIEDVAAEIDFEVTGVDAGADGIVISTTMTDDQASDAEQACEAIADLGLSGLVGITIEGDSGTVLAECDAGA